MNFIRGLPRFGGYDSCLVVTCGLSRFTRVIPCNKKITGEQTVKMLVEQRFEPYGAPKQVHSDVMASNSSSAASAEVAVAIALQSVNTKEASNANCVNESCKILRSLDRVLVFEIVLCIGAPSKDPARFVDWDFGF